MHYQHGGGGGGAHIGPLVRIRGSVGNTGVLCQSRKGEKKKMDPLRTMIDILPSLKHVADDVTCNVCTHFVI